MSSRFKSGLLFYCVIGFASSNALADVPLANIEGDLPDNVKTLLMEVLGKVDNPARSLAQARRRVVKANESALSVMRSQGYYGAEIYSRVREIPETDDSDARLILQPTLTIKPGSQFTLGNLDTVYSGATPDISQEVVDKINLKIEEPALAAKIVATELQIVNYLNANGFPDAIAAERKAIVDHASQTMSLTYNIAAGQKTRFGEIKQIGTAYLVKSWPEMISPFETGEVFDAQKLNSLASRVIGTGVFDGAVASLSDDAISNSDGTVTRNVMLNVEQGAVNTVSGEVGFSTTDGSGIDLTYERRFGYRYLLVDALFQKSVRSYVIKAKVR